MLSRRTLAGIGLVALVVATDTVQYHGSVEGLAVLVVFALGVGTGYRVGTVLRGGLYGALVSVGLAVVVLVLGAVALVAVLLLTTPQHRGWGFLGLGIGPALLANPLGLVLGGLYFGTAGLFGGLGGVVGGTVALGRSLSATVWSSLRR